MVKQLILATTLVFVNNPEAISFVRDILNFIMLAKYILHFDKMLAYIVYTLYRVDKTKKKTLSNQHTTTLIGI